ncbi:MAG TPA: flavodoxin family protein, partial [Methanoregula sp.]|nr:flavodoxin family protein [Methanoregula sp.]
MEPVRTVLKIKETVTDKGTFTLTLCREDFSLLYPGMVRFELTVTCGIKTFDVFRTNTYEYSPLVPLAAETVAQKKADEWEHEISTNPHEFLINHHVPVIPVRIHREKPAEDLVIIQGSPRPDGNCGILSSWARDAANTLGRTTRVI